jgi:hypothetical protein
MADMLKRVLDSKAVEVYVMGMILILLALPAVVLAFMAAHFLG